ncbi:hypothetical protein Tco_1334138, partial [Tanacetum coccineum]
VLGFGLVLYEVKDDEGIRFCLCCKSFVCDVGLCDITVKCWVDITWEISNSVLFKDPEAMGSEGAGGSEGSSKRRKEKSSDHIPCPTPLRTIEAVTSDVFRGDRVISPTQTQGDNLLEAVIPPGVREEMNLLDNNVVLDRAWFSLARGAMVQAHAFSQFESLYDTHHALQESLETTRSHLVRTREDFNVVQNFYNTLSERHRKLREEHAQCSEGLAVVQTERDRLMAT